MALTKSVSVVIAFMLALTFYTPVDGANPSTGALEGSVSGQDGRPIKDVFIFVTQGSYITQGYTAVIPLFPKNGVGVLVLNDSDAVQVHEIASHSTKTDRNGHYDFKALSPGTYKFYAARRDKKAAKDHQNIKNGLRCSEDGRTCTEVRKTAVSEHLKGTILRTDEISIRSGQPTVWDVVVGQ